MDLKFWKSPEVELKTTQVSINSTSFNIPRNSSLIESAIELAADQNSDLLLTDEMNLIGYDSGDDFQYSDNEKTLYHLNYLAQRANELAPNLIFTVGHPWRLNEESLNLDLAALAARAANPSEMYKDPIINRHSRPFNVQSVISGGKIIAMTAKSNLFIDERGDEARYFSEWSASSPIISLLGGTAGTIDVSLTEDGKNNVPFGRPIIYVKDTHSDRGYALAQGICEEKWVASQYDLRFDDDSHYSLFNPLAGYEKQLKTKQGLVLAIANASPPAQGKILKHAHLSRMVSKEFANVVYDTDGLGVSGSTFAQLGHRLVAQDGEIKHSGSRIDFLDSAHSTSVTKFDAAPKSVANRAHVTIERAFQEHFKHDGLNNFKFAAYEGAKQTDNWDSASFSGRYQEEQIRMLALWSYDYMRKCKQNGVVQALSGGKDSAFNMTIAVLAMRLAIKQKGLEGVMEDFAHLPYNSEILALEQEQDTETATKEFIKRFATGVTMPTGNNSKPTIKAAKDLADGLGVSFHSHNVQDLVDYYAMLYAVKDTTKLNGKEKHKLQKEISAYLNQSKDSVTEDKLAKQAAAIKKKYPTVDQLITAAKDSDSVAYENIQARARQVFIMMYANMEAKMALANPNLDEALNAYATFGGDLHSGTVNINAGLYKFDQIELMNYLMNNGLDQVIAPLSCLESTMEIEPTAGLLPLGKRGEQVQTDAKAMEATPEQIKALNQLILHDKMETQGGLRRFNVHEVFNEAAQNRLFSQMSENILYSTMRKRYANWNGGPAQPKVHASPIAPTTGNNVDKQASLRTPNISAANRDDLTVLGLKLLFKWAKEDNRYWGSDLTTQKHMQYNALHNEAFINSFEDAISPNGDDALSFDLKALYDQIKEDGPEKFFNDVLKTKPSQAFTINHALNSGKGSF